ncbi:dynamin-binding protein-like isoform X2 [Chelonus insularis]|uniref:dynamin-binding protein-like isoform X2 n=1 Tax=Chelonus insularis TaxID=460826 RepID=UPI00158BCB0E|nr:dynamin-binding protein-like isoform X2 [Chelonus insularis]
MERGTLTKVINDFFTVVDGELSLSKGDFFLIHDVIDKYWYYGESRDKRGSFPSNHLHKVDLPNCDNSENIFVAIAPFQGEQEGDLSFSAGELVIGEQQVGTDWYFGRINSRTGIFPSTHVWLLNPSILKKNTSNRQVKKKAKVKASLKAQLNEELDLAAGEIVTVLEILGDGWVLGVTSDGRKGTFPESFIIYIEDHTDSGIDLSDQAFGGSMDPFPESVASEGKIFKDFGYSVPSLSMEEPAPSYYDLFPNARSQPHHTDVYETHIPTNNTNHKLNLLGEKPHAITLYPFNAQFPNELNFKAGEVVHLIKHIDSEWSEGTIDNQIGIFPTSYVSIIVDCYENNDEQTPKNYLEAIRVYKKLFPGDKIKVQYTFNAQMNGDLSIDEGEIVTVVETVNDDWLSVKNKHGDIGLCPRGYLSDETQAPTEVEQDIEDFVVIRNPERNLTEAEEIKPKRLSEPHRPAPPAPVPGSTPLSKPSITNKVTNENENQQNIKVDEIAEAKRKRADQRQNVISELVITEKEYVRDLKITYETFHLYDPSMLEIRGIDVSILFGNILEVIHVAEELLDSLLKAMKGKDENEQMISPCFLQMADKLQSVYVKYCSNQEAALSLLKKYEENRDIMIVFEKGIETLRYQIACFDMSSILIKPVQRILKYHLMLSELLKCTEDGHPDKVGIEQAGKAMTAVALYINEYKRRKDIVSKYLDCDNTLIGKMSKLNMHSVAKKSSRLSAKLASTLGLTNIPPDPVFEELERQFKSLEKCASQLIDDIEQCLSYLNEDSACGELISDYINQFYSGVNNNEVYQYHLMRMMIASKNMALFRDSINKKVIQPINSLITMLEGPAMLITKRHDKLLDYDNAISKAEKNKESRAIQEELTNTKSNYEALNQQLQEELPILIEASTKIIVACIREFTNARKLLNGRIMQQYLNLPTSITQSASGDILQTFLINHNLLWNQISRFSFAGVNPKVEEAKVDMCLQSEKARIALRQRFRVEKLYVVQEDLISISDLDLGAAKGTIVGIIKTQDPMGDSSRWFVDNGTTQGFIPRHVLQPLAQLQSSSLVPTINNDVVDSRTNLPDLISLDSPEKITNIDLISLESPEKQSKTIPSSLSQSSWYLNLDEIHNDNKNYQNLPIEPEPEPSQRYQNLKPMFYHARYDFNEAIPGTLAVKEDQELKLIRSKDEKGNTEWWLMEDRDGKTGYVPSNYLN